MRDGRAGLGHPPWQGRGGGGWLRRFCKGVFLKGSERPEAGQPRRIIGAPVIFLGDPLGGLDIATHTLRLRAAGLVFTEMWSLGLRV